MQIKWPVILTILIYLLFPYKGKSFELSPQAEISVLTCSPGNEAYSVYGHSAIRIKDEFYNYDAVFNYGLFDFNTPNFVYRFAKGETDYLLGAYNFDRFYDEYVQEKRSIYEQVLNISPLEKQKIYDFLVWNAQPENRVYRYNFFFDNCATRIRDVVVQQVEGEVVFPEEPENPKTFRQLIKEYHSKLPWLNFGIDLAVSSPADRVATVSEEMFLPDYLMKYFAEATIITDESPKSLVMKTQVIYQAPNEKYKSMKAIAPVVIFSLLFLVVLIISIKQFRKNKIIHWLDYLVYGITGFMGLVMLWFVIFSEHPAMKPNYNLLWAIPLNLIFTMACRIKNWSSKIKYYHIILSAWLLILVFLSGAVVPQKFHPAFYLLILIVLSRSVLNSIFILQKKC